MNIFVQDHLDYLDMYTGCSDEKNKLYRNMQTRKIKTTMYKIYSRF